MPMEATAVSARNNGREDQLQFLRFLAFLNVFIYHAEMWLFFEYPASHCAFAAVSFFFVLSGGLAGYTGYGREQKPTIRDCGKYIWKKWTRVYPLYFVTVLVTVVTSAIPGQLASGDFAGAWPSVKQLLRNLLLVQAWFPEGYYSFNGVGWYLSGLMFLYTLNLPAVYLLNRANRRPRWFLVLGGAFCGILFATAAYCYLTQSYDMDYLQYILPAARMGEYLGGMILGFGIRRVKAYITPNRLITFLFTVLEAGALVFWFVWLRRPGNYWMNRIVSWLVPGMFLFGVFTMGLGWISRLFRWRPLVLLGNVSFECYLVHQIFITWFRNRYGASIVTQGDKAMAFCVCLTVSLLLAFLLSGWGKRKNTKKTA